MDSHTEYRPFHQKRTFDLHYNKLNTRKTISSILKDRLYRALVIPAFIISMIFVLIPGILEILQILRSASFEKELFVVFLWLCGLSLVFMLLARTLFFRYRDLFYERNFAGLFILLMGSMTIGSIWNEKATGIGALASGYQARFHAIFQKYDEGYASPKEENRRMVEYSEAEALVFSIFGDSLVMEYADYGLHKYYMDEQTDEIEPVIYKVLSLYRVIMEEFQIQKDALFTETELNPGMLLRERKGSHQALTIFFAACLKQIYCPFDFSNYNEDRSLIEFIVTREEFLKLKQALSDPAWPYPTIAWFVIEFTTYQTAEEWYYIPLYLPVHGKGYENSSPEVERDGTQFLISGIGPL